MSVVTVNSQPCSIEPTFVIERRGNLRATRANRAEHSKRSHDIPDQGKRILQGPEGIQACTAACCM
jgi:hypothetical protein